jgi:type IV pilus assembly protein PilM
MGLIDLFVRSSTPQSAVRGRVVGIDIGSSAIKVVELEDRDGVVTLTTYGELQLGPYEEGKNIGQALQLTPALERQALVDILRESAVKAKSAVLAIPLSASFVTTMNLLAGEEEDITPRVRVEARKYIPVPIADVTLDWAEVGGTTGEQTSRTVLLAAIQNDALKRFMSLLQTVELAGAPTEIECFSAIRAAYSSEFTDVAIVDIGASMSKLYIMQQGVLQRMHRIPTAGIKVTEKIAEERSCTFAEAEELKRTVTTSHPQLGLVQKIFSTTFSRVFKEFRQVVDEYESETGKRLTTIYICGGTSQFMLLDKELAHFLDRTVVRVTPFERVAYPAFMEDTLRTIGPVFAPALGAALRQFE